MKILHTNFLHGWGGQSNRILNVCRGLAERGYDILIVAPGDSELVRRANAAGLKTDTSISFRRGLRPLALIRDIRQMRRLIAEHQFDIIHTHGPQDSWLVAFANRPKRAPVIRTKHNSFPIRDHFGNRWLYGRVFDRIICISEAILEQCTAKLYIPPNRLAFIHSAIELDRYAKPDPAAVAALRAQWGGRNPVVVVIARLREEKGHRFLFEAMARLRSDFPAILLVVSGVGSLRAEMEQRVAVLGVADLVRFIGFRTDIPELLAAADLFVLPSVSEGLGTAAIEASAAGRPIVASRIDGIPDIVRDGETGRLANPGDAEDLARVMKEVLSDRVTAERYAAAARRRAFAHFAVQSLVEKNIAVYSELLDSLGRRPAKTQESG